ncbi:AraC family transcriptional regulator [Paenibacillus peoriae]|uniref:AraC family transcriptional regulator n=1 Tax=Paenibacillus peoriae TaxID=59893 RepID=UPI00026C64B9|nr:AraC family transcriptional regulator [Paenibacillus peoriae]MEC0184160.1 AraC family transcriptional regulator [Paenibacillus peoriae]
MPEEIRMQQNKLADLIERHCPREGVHETAIPSLFFIRLSHTTEPAYRIYKPSFCFIAKGLKEVFLAQERFTYGPANYLIASMNLPVVGQVIKASPNVPYLSFKLEFTQSQILEVLNSSEFQPMPKENSKRALFVGQMESDLMDAILRLARLLDEPKDIPFLAPLFVREILYRLLQGQYGVTLGQIAMEGSNTYQIREAIEQIIHHYVEPLRVEELAEIASMSVSSFHRNFKEVTAMSPLQFQKQLRLQEARRLLLSESADAADVAFRIGYESASQFSREYSRMFGSPPRADIKRLKENFHIE